ncbi:hypothetical protein DPX39_100103900 [Trypanosoma brucei equiperdum]|uniref:Uncharacterized protein n=1 Tax=Trypanosoma brucei equiperdum TaxID=630700 RepID=A0A3L6L0C2_9TRYP|nr:hypothetical protein DPX39_100103900 [Trypanosoma brucei equiperdum]
MYFHPLHVAPLLAPDVCIGQTLFGSY